MLPALISLLTPLLLSFTRSNHLTGNLVHAPVCQNKNPRFLGGFHLQQDGSDNDRYGGLEDECDDNLTWWLLWWSFCYRRWRRWRRWRWKWEQHCRQPEMRRWQTPHCPSWPQSTSSQIPILSRSTDRLSCFASCEHLFTFSQELIRW